VVVEQPRGIIYRGLRTIAAGLRLAGFETEVEIVSASERGAPHERQRVFIVAHANHLALQQRKGWAGWSEHIGSQIEIARSFVSYPETQPRAMPVDDGIPAYLARLDYERWWRYNPPPTHPGVEPRTPGRAEAINLAGLSICIPQATVPLMRLQFLAHLLFEKLETHG